MPEFSDEELIEAHRVSPPGSQANALLDELFRRYHSRVALWCFRMTGDREAAADLAQDIFIKVFRNLAAFRGDARFSTWLYSVARNHCFTHLKSRVARDTEALDAGAGELTDTAPDPEQLVERADSGAAIRDLVRRALTETELKVMTLHFVDDLPLDSITRLLGLENASGAKAYVVSAKRKLAPLLAAWKAHGARSERR